MSVPAATSAPAGLRRTVTTLGWAAALVSFAQVAIALTAVHGAAHDTAAASAGLFDAINVADAVKLVLLAGFTALLYASLPLLLFWAGSIALTVGRRAH